MSGDFGVIFVGHSYPILQSNFVHISPLQWVLDVCGTVKPNYWDMKEVVLFLTSPAALNANQALTLYVTAADVGWEYRGCVHAGMPSDTFPLQWPSGKPVHPNPLQGHVQVGISLEPLTEVAHKEGTKMAAKEEFAKRVGMDLYRFLESFHTQQDGDKLIIPSNALDRWFTRFGEKFRKDPDFLTRDREKF